MEKVKATLVFGFISLTAIILFVFIREPKIQQKTKPEYELILINQNTIQVKEISTGTTVKCNPDSLVFVLEDLNK